MRFGEIIVLNDGCEVVVHHFLKTERTKVPWSDANVWSSDGNFFVGSKTDKKAYASASYMDVDNTHILEAMIRGYFKKYTEVGLGTWLLN